MNNHISCCRSGNSTNQFDIHVHKCMKEHDTISEPYFKIYIFMELPHEKYLLPYETYQQSKKHDNMN